MTQEPYCHTRQAYFKDDKLRAEVMTALRESCGEGLVVHTDESGTKTITGLGRLTYSTETGPSKPLRGLFEVTVLPDGSVQQHPTILPIHLPQYINGTGNAHFLDSQNPAADDPALCQIRMNGDITLSNDQRAALGAHIAEALAKPPIKKTEHLEIFELGTLPKQLCNIVEEHDRTVAPTPR